MSFKYIMFRKGDREFPVIFPEVMVHSMLALAIQDYYVLEAIVDKNKQLTTEEIKAIQDTVKVVSAGQCNMTVISCGGKSDTLNTEARPNDADAINVYPYTHGYVGGDDDSDDDETGG